MNALLDPSSLPARLSPPDPCGAPLPRGCTFAEKDWRILANYWYPVAIAAQIKEAPIATRLLDQRLVIYRTNEGITVANDLCLHRGVPLSMGWCEKGQIICKYHGFHYNAQGKCTAMPAHPDAIIPPKLHLKTYPVREAYGLIWTCLSGHPANPLPDLPQFQDDSYQVAWPDPIDLQAAAGRQVESFLDVAHFAWIHHETFGDRNNPVVPNYPVERTPVGLNIIYRSTVGDYLRQDGTHYSSDQGVVRIFDVTLPFSARLIVEMPDNARLVILNTASPISARQTRLFPVLLRNYDQHEPVQPFIDYNNKIFSEDTSVVQAQCPEDLPLDLTEEVHIKADRTSIAFRQELGRLGLGTHYTS